MAELIAETDEVGAVVCVWVLEPHRRSPRVFDPDRHGAVVAAAGTRCHGAPREAILDWIETRRLSGAT